MPTDGDLFQHFFTEAGDLGSSSLAKIVTTNKGQDEQQKRKQTEFWHALHQSSAQQDANRMKALFGSDFKVAESSLHGQELQINSMDEQRQIVDASDKKADDHNASSPSVVVRASANIHTTEVEFD